MAKPKRNVRIDPCSQSGETVMGRRLVMLVGPVRGSGRGTREARRRPSRGSFPVRFDRSSDKHGIRPDHRAVDAPRAKHSAIARRAGVSVAYDWLNNRYVKNPPPRFAAWNPAWLRMR